MILNIFHFQPFSPYHSSELDGPPTTKNIPQTKQTENSQIPTPTPTPDASIVPKGSSESDNIKPKTNSSVVPFNPIKYQYYQSGDCLNISILVKGISEEEVRESSFLVLIDLQLHIQLFFKSLDLDCFFV